MINSFGLALVAISCNVGAQIAMKYAGNQMEKTVGISAWMNSSLILAVILYGISFLLTVKVFAVNLITVVAPVMAGSVFVLVGIIGSLVFNESVSVERFFGMFCILVGIIIISRSV